jgi:hypothetical protein
MPAVSRHASCLLSLSPQSPIACDGAAHVMPAFSRHASCLTSCQLSHVITAVSWTIKQTFVPKADNVRLKLPGSQQFIVFIDELHVCC